ncbi:CpsB/CapC family capsule biosynthesis tyrosine phosphatase [Bacillus coahuilensis]|uniref:CpsB/CapC family capsule biosynthesis tyrosine phosphatase n=1 Tax=Bacillus coahuilensis TaxID=408580 RepID=UPI001F4CFD1B|nr:CpsB/CapC family capsule biosynthesis tyrosine phosphatase [Bacillus coahuilensis]
MLESHDLSVHILPEQDLSVYGESTEDIQAFVSQPYLFMEFHRATVPAYAERLIYEIQLAGYSPVILNPERNVEFIQNPNRLYQLVKNGALAQISAESILGNNGKTFKKKVWRCFKPT